MDLQLKRGEVLEILPAFLTGRAVRLQAGIEGKRSPATLASLWR
ncbi:MAG TPA: hypothetical protein VF859_00045 [Burkholderiales bacterium]